MVNSVDEVPAPRTFHSHDKHLIINKQTTKQFQMGGLGLGSREGVRDPAVRSREAGGGESVPLASKLPLEMAQVAVVLCSSVSTECPL